MGSNRPATPTVRESGRLTADLGSAKNKLNCDVRSLVAHSGGDAAAVPRGRAPDGARSAERVRVSAECDFLTICSFRVDYLRNKLVLVPKPLVTLIVPTGSAARTLQNKLGRGKSLINLLLS